MKNIFDYDEYKNESIFSIDIIDAILFILFIGFFVKLAITVL